MLPEVRMTRVVNAIGLHRKKLSCVEAGELQSRLPPLLPPFGGSS